MYRYAVQKLNALKWEGGGEEEASLLLAVSAGRFSEEK